MLCGLKIRGDVAEWAAVHGVVASPNSAQIVFSSSNSAMPYFDPSRPIPDESLR